MNYKKSVFCVSNINFDVYICNDYFNDICEYMMKSLGENKKGDLNFDKEIYYTIDEMTFQKVREMIKKESLCDKKEYFKDQICFRYYINNSIWLIEENEEWIINIGDSQIYVYLSTMNEHKNIYLLRFLRSIAYGLNEDEAMVLLHGAAVLYDNKGVIIVGQKGSGKTSLLMRFIDNNSSLISNDRVFVSDNMNIIGFPQAVRVAPGTFENEMKLTQYYKGTQFYRKQDNGDAKDFKYLITADEMSKAYSNSVTMKHTLDYIVIPNVQIGSEDCEIEIISDEEKKKEIFDTICFTPIDESFRYEWIYSPQLSIDEKCRNRNIIWNKIKTKNFIKANYGTELESSEIINKIMNSEV